MRAMQCDICETVVGKMTEATYYQFGVPSMVVDGRGVENAGDSSMVEACEECVVKRPADIVAELMKRYNATP